MDTKENSLYQLEICANSLQSVINAQKAGAHRVELCAGLWEAGTTPSHATIKKSCELDIKVFVLIRPRGGDFVYTDLEFELIKEDIAICKSLGVDGIVSGVLKPDNTIDIERTQKLIELSKPLPFTFHRAFDLIENQEAALKQLIAIGTQRVLTSGGKASAPEAQNQLKKLVESGNDQIIILAGGGIKSNNISKLFKTGCKEFHMTANAIVKSPAAKGPIVLNSSTIIPEQNYKASNFNEIINVIHELDTFFSKND
jgi:copper homeostasis protein